MNRELAALKSVLARLDREMANPRLKWTLAGFILAHGTVYTPQPLSERFKRGAVKELLPECPYFGGHGRPVYVEGYALGRGTLPVHHAWCSEPGSKLVIDTTSGETEGHAYFGVPFDTLWAAAFFKLSPYLSADLHAAQRLSKLLEFVKRGHGLLPPAWGQVIVGIVATASPLCQGLEESLASPLSLA